VRIYGATIIQSGRERARLSQARSANVHRSSVSKREREREIEREREREGESEREKKIPRNPCFARHPLAV